MGIFIDLLEEAEEKQWCVHYMCTTCGSRDFRTRLANIDSLDEDLRKTSPRELIEHHCWSDALRIAANDFRFMSWDAIFQSWLPDAAANISFLDHVLFYLINYVPCKSESRDQWVAISIRAALSSKSPSLLESLIRVLGTSAESYPKLVETALEISANNSRLHHALVKCDFLPDDTEVAKINRESKMRLRANQNLRPAIKRKDIKAIESMLKWKPDLNEKNHDGVSIMECARLSEDSRIHSIFDEYCGVKKH